jgi:hypothetical protein
LTKDVRIMAARFDGTGGNPSAPVKRRINKRLNASEISPFDT